ncbi:MAG: acetylglutamate kinase [Schwartzia sp.]|nr:acetylglutamate kinase [Schwartzia sp. (in: firmicutes)]MBR5163522.1 acetylglutamate kinase [Schwartzia sp. (in: firmicutes)]
MFSPQDTANLLVEALPYFQKFSGKTIVVKYGGNAMVSEELKEKVMQDVTLMKQVGIRPVIVHGGGPDITGFLKKVGKDTEFVSGLRVTDEETMEIVGMVLIGKVNADVVMRLNVCGNRAVGLSGVDAELIRAKKKLAVVHEGGGEQKVDIGHVGEVESVDAKILEDNLDRGYIPVVAPIGVDEDGAQYNINADYVAAAIAGALKAEKLLLLTDVEGVYKNYEDKSTFLSSLTQKEAEAYIEDGTISGGMIPKVEACLTALRQGAQKTSIIDGRLPHSLLLELFTEQGIGTEIVKE